LLPLLLGLQACGGTRPSPTDPDDAQPETPTTTTPSFLSVGRSSGGAAADAARVKQMKSSAPAAAFDPNNSFYVAIHRRELDQRWFASAYLKQFSPDAVLGGAASALGTRVVSFRIQNGKLFMFDVDDRKQTSDTFGHDQIVDAYPIIDPGKIDGDLGRKLRDYVIIDPAAGLNRFGVVGDAFGSGYLGLESFTVELAFSQNFRAVEDGATFEQAFTGYTTRPRDNLDGVDPNYFRASGILGLSLRRYREGEGFVALPMPAKPHYFVTEPLRVPNTGDTAQLAVKWNIRAGMAPIEWLISPLAAQAQQAPELQALGVDVVGAIKAGIESWNVAFGFPALQAKLARPGDSFADDSKNYFIYDVNPTIGFAFADWRYNPNNGEIRGASVYFNDEFVQGALRAFAPPPPGGPEPVKPAPSPVAQRWLTWEPFPHQPLCDLRPSPLAEMRRTLDLGPGKPGTPKEQIEKAIAATVAHEIGHTLGLRHNFKGSLLPPSSSIMDYISDELGIASKIPGDYDIDAIRYLYGLAPALPAQPFCTDPDIRRDPSCAQFDESEDPLRKFWGPFYTAVSRNFLATGSQFAGEFTAQLLLPHLVMFMQSAALPDDRVAAWTIAVADVGIPVAPGPLAAFPQTFPAGANFLERALFGRLVPDPVTLLPPFPGAPAIVVPPIDANITGLLLGELRGNLLNADGIRSYRNRRLSIDTLKWMQTLAAYDVLRDSRTALPQPSDPAVPAADKALLEDLLARLHQAISPYFVK
jgi:hypothetical protein